MTPSWRKEKEWGKTVEEIIAKHFLKHGSSNRSEIHLSTPHARTRSLTNQPCHICITEHLRQREKLEGGESGEHMEYRSTEIRNRTGVAWKTKPSSLNVVP